MDKLLQKLRKTGAYVEAYHKEIIYGLATALVLSLVF